MFGVDEAVRVILSEDNAFFTSVMDKLIHSPDLKDQLRSLRLRGETIPYLSYNEKQNQLRISGLIQNNHNTVGVSNRIFAMRLYCYFFW